MGAASGFLEEEEGGVDVVGSQIYSIGSLAARSRSWIWLEAAIGALSETEPPEFVEPPEMATNSAGVSLDPKSSSLKKLLRRRVRPCSQNPNSKGRVL